jgi:two-component sensor histidine kinase
MARAVAAILVLAVVVFTPFSAVPVARIDAFIPAFEGTILVTDLITSVLLFSQFSIYRLPALLALACGYLFSALTLVAHGLTFPGAFSPGGLLGAGLQSTAWIYWFWHFGFPLALLAYGLLKDQKPTRWLVTVSVSRVIVASVTSVIALAGGLILLATAGNDLMPLLGLDRVHIAPLNHVVGGLAMLLCVSALAVLWVRRRSVLDQWVMVVAVAAISELALAVLFTSARYSLGFYVGRIFSFFAATVVLVVLLVETGRLYARVANAFDHQKLLVGELDHRVKNILATIVAMVESTRRQGTGIPDDFAQAIEGRLRSMADAHGLLSQSSWRGARLGEIVRKQLAPYAIDANVAIDGTDLVLDAAATQAIAMTLHELVTNSVKYGALSSPNGRVSVLWERRSNGAAVPLLRIEWREHGGPPPSASILSGYGTNLIRDLIPHELGGKVDLVFASDGASCNIEIRLERL